MLFCKDVIKVAEIEFKVLCCTLELHSVKISEVTIKMIKTLARNLGDQDEVEDNHGGPN